MPLVLWRGKVCPNFERGYKGDILRQMEGMHGNKERGQRLLAQIQLIWASGASKVAKVWRPEKEKEIKAKGKEKIKAKGQQSHAQVVPAQIQFLILFLSHIYLASLCY